MTKIAIISAGQFRVSDSISTSVANVRDVKSSVFITTWSCRGLKRRGWFSAPQFHRVLSEPISLAIPPQFYGTIDELEKLVPSYFAHLDELIQKMPTVRDEVAAIFPEATVDIEEDSLFVPANATWSTNTERMLYKILRGLALMRREELLTGEKFTHVLKIRPDVAFSGNLESLDLDSFCADWVKSEEGELRCGDSIMIAPRDVFEEVMCQVYHSYLDHLLNSRDCDIHLLIGSVVGQKAASSRQVASTPSIGEWPIDLFKEALADKAATSTLALAIYKNIVANEAVWAGRGNDALEALKSMPAEWARLPGVLWATMKANESTGNPAQAYAAASDLKSIFETCGGLPEIFQTDAASYIEAHHI